MLIKCGNYLCVMLDQQYRFRALWCLIVIWCLRIKVPPISTWNKQELGFFLEDSRIRFRLGFLLERLKLLVNTLWGKYWRLGIIFKRILNVIWLASASVHSIGFILNFLSKIPTNYSLINQQIYESYPNQFIYFCGLKTVKRKNLFEFYSKSLKPISKPKITTIVFDFMPIIFG